MGRSFSHFNWFIICPILILGAFSLSLLASISGELFWQQTGFFAIGILLFVIAASLDLTVLIPFWPIIYAFSVLLLLSSFLGPEVRGATRWLQFGEVRVQPSELVKPLFIFAQAAYLSSFQKIRLHNTFSFLIIFFIPALVIFKQPDLGNAIIYSVTTAGLLFVSRISFANLVVVGLAGTAIFPFSWFILQNYQKQRLLSFLNPHMDSHGAGYNALQAMIAIGSGGIFGRGLGRGPQSHLRFLPENHTDFIFATLTEELGFLGASLVISLYFSLLFQLFLIYRKSPTFFTQYLALGLFIQLLFQIVINIGMNMGLLPITGITLPLVSYGGSSILATSFSLGLVQRIFINDSIKRKAIAIG